MTSPAVSSAGAYSLATGDAAVRRLKVIQEVYGPTGERLLRQAGLTTGMEVADFGCGVGLTTLMLAEIVGSSGRVIGIDISAAQLEQARGQCAGLANVSFVEARATATGLPGESVDLAYCRFLLLHLTDPAACLKEMHRVLRPGGLLVVEDADLTAAGSDPPSSLAAFADLFARLGPTRGLDYAMARNLREPVEAAGFQSVEIATYQPALARGESRFILKWSVDEIGPGCVAAGLVTHEDLAAIQADMQRDTEDERILVLTAPVTQVWGRKPR